MLKGKIHLSRLIIGLVTVGLFATVIFAFQGSKGPSPGEPAPDFTLTLYNGEPLSLSDLRGHAVVLHFWASWCPPCQKEMPLLTSLWDEYKDKGVILIGISYEDVEDKARAFIKEHKVTFPCGLDTRGRIAASYGVTGVPETYFISPEGILIKRHIGPVDEATFRKILDELSQ